MPDIFSYLLFLGLIAGAIALIRQARRLDGLERDLERLRAGRERPEGTSSGTGSMGPVPTPAPAPAVPQRSGGLPMVHGVAPAPGPVVPPPLPQWRSAVPPTVGAATAGAGPVSASPANRDSTPASPAGRKLDWEQFVGVKLIAWLGGFALFLAAAFFLKYSFEHDLIPPAARAAIGYVFAIALVSGGLRLSKRYEATAQTLVGSGVVILYAVTYACNAIYRFPLFGYVPTLLLMMLITVAAFLLAVRMNGQVVAILGLLGGFLTPVLLKTGIDNPFGLFSYVTLLNLGLFAVVWHRRWFHLVLPGAMATIGVQIGWWLTFYTPEKLVVLQVIQPWFVALFAAFFLWSERRGKPNRWITAGMLLTGAYTLLSGLGLAVSESGEAPIRLFILWLLVDALLLTVALLTPRFGWLEPGVGGAVFVLLATWTAARATAEFLFPALGAYFAYAVLHTVIPVVRLRLRPAEGPGLWSQMFPLLTLALFVLPLLKDTGALPVMYWMAVLAVNVLALILAVLAGAFLAVLGVMALTLVVAGIAISRTGLVAMSGNESLLVIAGFAALFVGGGWWLWRRGTPVGTAFIKGLGGFNPGADPRLPICGSGSVLPFLLLAELTMHVSRPNPHALFGLTAVLLVLVLGLARATGFHLLAGFGLAGAGLVQWTWHAYPVDPANALGTIAWHLGFYAAFTLFPFLIARPSLGRRSAWITGALAGPLHFGLVYLTMKNAWPDNPVAGLIPAAFAIPALGTLAWLARHWASEAQHRLTVLSWQGGVALFLITLIFPIQFDREWLTVAWSLEGAALLWLFHRLPHPGLRHTGLALLAVAFCRLTLNPFVLSYHPRTGTRILNWYLFVYPTATAAFFAGAQLLRPPYTLLGSDVRPVLRGMGMILLFVLMNLEIADYFADGPTLTFDFSSNLPRDLSYTIGWALFALALVVAGIAGSSRFTRYAGLGLLGITLLKLFFHDLARLDQLYRIAAFGGVAVIAIAASFLYQRFLSRPDPVHEVSPP